MQTKIRLLRKEEWDLAKRTREAFGRERDPFAPRTAVVFAVFGPAAALPKIVGGSFNWEIRQKTLLDAKDVDDKRFLANTKYGFSTRDRWLARLAKEGKEPRVEVLETVAEPTQLVEKAEKWFQHFEEKGAKLVVSPKVVLNALLHQLRLRTGYYSALKEGIQEREGWVKYGKPKPTPVWQED